MARNTIEEIMSDYDTEAQREIYNEIKAKFFHQDHEMIQTLANIVIEGVLDNSESANDFVSGFLSKLEVLALRMDTENFEYAYGEYERKCYVESFE